MDSIFIRKKNNAEIMVKNKKLFVKAVLGIVRMGSPLEGFVGRVWSLAEEDMG